MEMEKNIAIENKNYNDLKSQVKEWEGYSARVKLLAYYGTTKPNHVGTVTYVSPYTTFTGVTLFASWNESVCDYHLYANQKDAYIFASGTVTIYLVIEGIGNILDLPVNLGRVCYLAR